MFSKDGLLLIEILLQKCFSLKKIATQPGTHNNLIGIFSVFMTI